MLLPGLIFLIQSHLLSALPLEVTGTREQLKPVTASPNEKNLNYIHIIIILIHLFCTTCVVLDILYNIRQNHKEKKAKLEEENKKKALGRNYGTCSSTKINKKRSLHKEPQSRKNGNTAQMKSILCEKAMDQPYVIHPVL